MKLPCSKRSGTFYLSENLDFMQFNKLAGLLMTASMLLFVACNQPGSSNQQAPTADQPANKDYFKDTTSGIKDGGVQMVSINTPKGPFKVWTKRFGNNPKIKLLLLNGGPGATHEYFECMESFLPAEDIEFIY